MSWRSRLSCNMREIRFLLCPNAEHSAGARRFIQNNYAEIKTLNPKLPFIIREYPERKPVVIARYDYGAEAQFELENLSEREITEKVRELSFYGSQTLKATAFPWQQSVPQDEDVVDFSDVQRRGW